MVFVNFFIFKNLNLGIDFKGGILIEAKFNSVPNLIDLRSKISSSIFGNIEIQEFGSFNNIV